MVQRLRFCRIWARSATSRRQPPGAKSIEVFDEDTGHRRTLALFSEDPRHRGHARQFDRAASPVGDAAVPPADNGARAGWPGELWEELRLDRFLV